MCDYSNKEKQKTFEINSQREITESVQESNVFQQSQDLVQTQRTEGLNSMDGSSFADDVFVKQEKMINDLEASYREEEKKRIKAVKEPEITYHSEYVGLYSSNTITVEDSDKMIAVKQAIDEFQASRGTLAEKHTLESVIRACNKYTRLKFSLFKFGKASQRLSEVKAVREQAERELQRIKEEEKNLNPRQKEELKKDRLESLRRVGAYDTTQYEKAGFVKNKAKEIRKKYPALTKEEANKFASDAFERHSLMENTKEIEDLLQYKKQDEASTIYVEKKIDDAVKEKISKNHNAFSAFFVRLFCFSSVKKDFVRDTIYTYTMSKGMSVHDFDEAYSKNSTDILKIILGLKKGNKTVEEMNRNKSKSRNYNNTFI